MEYKCQDCEFVGKNQFALQIHRKQEHPDKPSVEKKEEPIYTTVHLKNFIRINGTGYSGTVRVSPSLARDLKYRDDSAEATKARDHQLINIETQHPLKELRG